LNQSDKADDDEEVDPDNIFLDFSLHLELFIPPSFFSQRMATGVRGGLPLTFLWSLDELFMPR